MPAFRGLLGWILLITLALLAFCIVALLGEHFHLFRQIGLLRM
jgi:hypothetical protein